MFQLSPYISDAPTRDQSKTVFTKSGWHGSDVVSLGTEPWCSGLDVRLSYPMGADLTSVKCKGKWLSKPWTSGFLVTDDADPLKTAADQNGVWVKSAKAMSDLIPTPWLNNCKSALPNGVNPSLAQINVSVQQALLDIPRLKEMIHLRQPEARSELETHVPVLSRCQSFSQRQN